MYIGSFESTEGLYFDIRSVVFLIVYGACRLVSYDSYHQILQPTFGIRLTFFASLEMLLIIICNSHVKSAIHFFKEALNHKV